jgi:NAD(P)-dependent dehydrogenase (short-subunit alcohol dehydrogenase family)
MKFLAPRVAFITGGASGIGQAIAAALLREGMKVAVADVDEARAQEAASAIASGGGEAMPVALDVSDRGQWEQALDRVEGALGPVALLVNSAGIGGTGTVADDDPSRWRRVLEVNALGTFYGCHAVLARFARQTEPCHIVNVASLSGLRANPGMSSYAASKFAVVGLSDALRQELAGSSVGLSLVYPGATRTRFLENSRQQLLGLAHEDTPDNGVKHLLDNGMDPAKLALRVLAAIMADEYHVFTHVGDKPAIEAIFQERLAAFGATADSEFRDGASASSHAIQAPGGVRAR